MSSSTVVLKKPSGHFPDAFLRTNVPEPKSPFLLATSLWLFSSIFSAAKIDFSANITGVSIGFNIQDVVLVAFTAWMLYRGLTTRNVALILPWIAVTVYGLHYNHYKSITKLTGILRHNRHSTALPWMALFMIGLGLVLRVILICRILQLSANLWYRKKLEKELYASLT